jgi:class 3 adenylate cyclase
VYLVPVFLSLFAGLSLSALVFAAFSYRFILTSLWLDPFIPLAGSLAGSLTTFLALLIHVSARQSAIRKALLPCAGAAAARRMARKLKAFPLPPETMEAAILSIRKADLPALENQGTSEEAAARTRRFREEARRRLTEAGAVILGYEGELVMAAFGSPLERIATRRVLSAKSRKTPPQKPAVRAALFAGAALQKKAVTGPWNIGIDSGPVTFYFSPSPHYTGSGRSVVRARLLSSLAPRCKAAVLSTKNAAENLPAEIVLRNVQTDNTGKHLENQVFELCGKE